jgi:hypothetical protein
VFNRILIQLSLQFSHFQLLIFFLSFYFLETEAGSVECMTELFLVVWTQMTRGSLGNCPPSDLSRSLILVIAERLQGGEGLDWVICGLGLGDLLFGYFGGIGNRVNALVSPLWR